MSHAAHRPPGKRRPLTIASVIAALVLAFAGGMLLANTGGGDEASPSASDSETPSTAPTRSPSPTQSPSPSPPALTDGRHFVYVTKLHGTPPDATLTFDLAEFLTGEAAAQAAAEHGDESPPPNDYYIVNDNPRLRTMPVTPNVTIQAIDWTNCCELTDVPYTDWAASLTSPTDALYGTETQYWITVSDGRIVAIEEQYLP
jgi:hypothetical protein